MSACLALSMLLLSGCSHEVDAPLAPGTPDTASPAVRNERLASVESWAFAIGYDLEGGDAAPRLAEYDLVVIDGQEAPPELVDELQETGTLVLGYVSVGTAEPDRPWTSYLEPYRLDYWEDWDEYYLDVSDPDCRAAVLEHVVAPAVSKEFDGLFIDNTDMVETHPAHAEGMRALVEAIDGVLGPDRVVFAQNGAEALEPLLPFLDGWNREDVTWTYDFTAEEYRPVSAAEHRAALAELDRMRDAGLLVLATDYTPGNAETDEECAEAARTAGALPYASDIELQRLGGSR